MAKFKIEYRGGVGGGASAEIEADEVDAIADGQHYRFSTGDLASGHKTVALIPAEVVKSVQKIEG